MMAGMAVGGAIENIAGTMNNMMSGVNGQQTASTNPMFGSYYISLN